MTCLPVRCTAIVLASIMTMATAAQAFTFNDQADSNRSTDMRFADPADRAKARMNSDSNDRSTIRNGPTSVQFGGRESFNQRNNGDRYFTPNNLMGR